MGRIEERVHEAIVEATMAVARNTAELQAGLQQFHNGQRLTAARYLPVAGRQLASTGVGRVVGWSVRSTSSTGGATVVLRDGRNDDADPLGVIVLAAGEAQTVWLGPAGVQFSEALWLDRDGDVDGAVYLGGVD